MAVVIPRLEKQGMVSRALSLATVTLLIGSLTAGVARAENLDAGKSPSQIFSGTCSACHKSPRGLLKNTPASSLPGFLRQHYTTGTEMASVLSSYLISNGAADPRYQGKDKKDARQDRRQEGLDQPERTGRRQRAAPAEEAARPDSDARPQGESARQGRERRRYGRSRVAPDAVQPADGQAPVQAATDSKPGSRQKHGKRGRPVPAEPSRTEQVNPAAKEDDTSRDASRSGTGAVNSARPGSVEPVPDTARSDTSSSDATIKIDPPRENTTIKVDAPKENAGGEVNQLRPDAAPSAASAPPASVASSPDSSVTATVPSSPAGPPVPPISR
jgi:hypothetical protein